jgi:hypothetical protein
VAVAYVRELAGNHAAGTAASATFAFNLTAGASAGDFVVMFAATKLTTNADSPIAVTDTQGNGWTVDVHDEIGNCYGFIASTWMNKGTLANGNTITLTLPPTNTFTGSHVSYWVEEFSGLGQSEVDRTASHRNPSALTGDTNTTLATSEPDEVAVAGIIWSAVETTITQSAYTAFTTGTQITPDRSMLACYKLLTTTGTQIESFTASAVADFSVGTIATYKDKDDTPRPGPIPIMANGRI